MTRASRRHSMFAFTVCLGLGACGDDAESAAFQRGSADCQAWQHSLCDFVDRCGALSYAACIRDYGGIECADDQAARSCAEQLNELSCVGVPEACGYEAIVDSAPAIATCERLIDKACSNLATCGYVYEECVAGALGGESCDDAIGIRGELEACETGLDEDACTQPMECQEVVVIRS